MRSGNGVLAMARLFGRSKFMSLSHCFVKSKGKPFRQMRVMAAILIPVLSLGSIMSRDVFAAENIDLAITSDRSVRVSETVSRNLEDVKVFKRGSFLTIHLRMRNLSQETFGPFDMRLFLSQYADGRDVAFEFDLLNEISLAGTEKADLTRTYLLPHFLRVLRPYYLVAEANPGRRIEQADENSTNRGIISILSIGCPEGDYEDSKPGSYYGDSEPGSACYEAFH